MKVEKVYEDVRYLLSNENLNEGDLVYPIAHGRQTDNDGWVLHGFDWNDTYSPFPRNPHTVTRIDVNPIETLIRTNYGYSNSESYFKIIKVERQVQPPDAGMFARWEWQTFDITELNIKAGNPNDLPF